MMKRTVLAIWFVAAAVLVAANTYVAYANVRKLIEHGAALGRSQQRIMAADAVLSTLKDAETGQRGYVITGAPEYLAPYTDALKQIDGKLAGLARLTADDAEERAQVAEIRTLADRRLAAAKRTMEIRDRDGLEAASRAIQEDRGKAFMDRIRQVVDDLGRAEERRLAEVRRARDDSVRTAVVTIFGAGIFNLFLVAMIAWAVRRDSVARARTSAAVVHRLALERDNARLIAEVDERRRVNATLTALTARLEQSNRELQDFASVASHDLQEPLRKIQAFGDRLRTRFAGPLGPDGRDYVDRMHAAAARMQTLIDDLLRFSRVTTKAHPFAPVDLNEIARDVLSDLEARIESSAGKVEVGELPTIDADPVQMRQLFQNLIANALKFRRPEAAPVVRVSASMPTEVGTPADDRDARSPKVEIRVADNGIGFEEKYLDRIFNVFQRLHGRDRYEGTGIGLAVCRKIVERHGGTITATSRPGEGATFVIALPTTQPEQPGDSPDAPQHSQADDAQADHHPAGR
jgi:signal transduction histidine kinase